MLWRYIGSPTLGLRHIPVTDAGKMQQHQNNGPTAAHRQSHGQGLTRRGAQGLHACFLLQRMSTFLPPRMVTAMSTRTSDIQAWLPRTRSGPWCKHVFYTLPLARCARLPVPALVPADSETDAATSAHAIMR